MKLIKLHKYDGDWNPVFIQAGRIDSFSRNDAYNATAVETDGGQWWVSETPEQIVSILQDTIDRDDMGMSGISIHGKDGTKVLLRD